MECNSEISTILSIHVIDQSIVSSPELAVSTCIGFFPNTTLFFFISLSYFMVFQFRSSIIDTRYFVSLYFSLQRVREEYCVYIYSFCKVKGKCRIKKKKKETKETNCIDTWLIFPSIMGKRIREWQEIQVIRGEWWTSGLVIQPRIIMQSFSRIFVANAKYIRAQIMQ